VRDSSRSVALAKSAFSAWLILSRERQAGEAEGSGCSAAPDASPQRWCLPEGPASIDSNQDQAVAGLASTSRDGPCASRPGASTGWCLPG